MTIKETLLDFIKIKGVRPPFSSKKIEKAGYDVSEFMSEFSNRIEKADNYKERIKKDKHLQDFVKQVKILKDLWGYTLSYLMKEAYIDS